MNRIFFCLNCDPKAERPMGQSETLAHLKEIHRLDEFGQLETDRFKWTEIKDEHGYRCTFEVV